MSIRFAAGVVAMCITAAAGAWEFNSEPDKMGRGEMKFAEVRSTNTVSFKFPYQGKQHATLLLQERGKKVEVLLALQKAHLLCSVIRCDVTVRFDDGKPVKWSASPPADHSTTVVFLNNEGKFMSSLRQAKIVRIETTFYQHGTEVFEFQVAGLGNWPAAAAPSAPKKGTQ